VLAGAANIVKWKEEETEFQNSLCIFPVSGVRPNEHQMEEEAKRNLHAEQGWMVFGFQNSTGFMIYANDPK